MTLSDKLDLVIEKIEAFEKKLDALERAKPDAVLELPEAAEELKVSVSTFRRRYLKTKLIAPLPRAAPGKGVGKRGGNLRFLFDDVQRLKGVPSAF